MHHNLEPDYASLALAAFALCLSACAEGFNPLLESDGGLMGTNMGGNPGTGAK